MAGQRTALVTGANGFVGSHLTEVLLEQGYHVRGLVRVTSDLRWVCDLPLQICHGCLEDEPSLEQALAGVDVVFHVAALTKAFDRADYFCVNVDGTRRVVRSCVRAGCRRLVFFSSAAAQGPSPDGHLMREDEDSQPLTPYGRSKLEAEEAVREESAGLEWVILRPPAVYGPRDTDMLELFRTVRRGLILSLGRGERWQSLVHVRDVARGALLAATAQEASGRVYNLCSPKPVEWRYVQRIIANAVGVNARRIVLPSFLIYPVAWWRQLGGRMVGKAPILSPQKVPEILARYWVLDHGRAERELGFRASVSLDEGIRQTVDWYRSVGWLS